jgi:xylulokinase
VRQIGAEVLGVAVEVPPSEEYVARGAARQAAWVLSPGGAPPDWAGDGDGWVRCEPRDGSGEQVRARYAEGRELTLSRP